MTVKIGCEDILQERDALVQPKVVEAEPLPSLRQTLDDERAGIVVEVVSVEPDPTRARLLETEGEGVEHLVSAEPNVLVLAHVDICLEIVAIEMTQPTIHTVASDDQVC